MFPFSRPRLFADKGLFLKYPHIDSDGGLCLFPDYSTHVPTVDAGMPLAFLHEAESLFRAGKAGVTKDDFIHEFLSYWEQTAVAPSCLSYVNPESPTRKIFCLRHDGMTYFFEDEDCARMWSQHYLPKSVFKTDRFFPSMLLWLPNPILPDSYPSTNADIAVLAHAQNQEALLLDAIHSAPNLECPVELGLDTINGPALFAVKLMPPVVQSIKGKARSTVVLDGFSSKGKIPKEILGARYLTHGTKVTRFGVQRVDPEWIHSRGGQGLSELFDRSVCLVGCGSVGCMVALYLAQAGCGTLTLIDPDVLSWDNVARYLMGGADFIGRRKSDALQVHLSAQFPHLNVLSQGDRTWEESLITDPADVSSHDLIVSTTGNFSTESAINYVERTVPSFPPVIYGWTEPHACAGHSLFVCKKGGCFACAMTTHGIFKHALVDWQGKETLVQEPACGAFYQPYGSVALASIQAMIAGQAIDYFADGLSHSQIRTWAGPSVQLQKYSARWSEGGEKFFGPLGDGGRFLILDWPVFSECGLCVKRSC